MMTNYSSATGISSSISSARTISYYYYRYRQLNSSLRSSLGPEPAQSREDTCSPCHSIRPLPTSDLVVNNAFQGLQAGAVAMGLAGARYCRGAEEVSAWADNSVHDSGHRAAG